MRVIPFNPGGAGRDELERPETAAASGGATVTGDGDAGDGADGERARIRRLEDALISLLRESASNWARAERAEQLLAERAPAPRAERG